MTTSGISLLVIVSLTAAHDHRSSNESHRTNVTLDCQTAGCAPNVRGNAKNNGRRSACKGQSPSMLRESAE